MPDSINSTESGPVRLYVVFAEDGETTLDGFIEKLQSVAEFTVRRRYESANAVIIQTDASAMAAISETDFVLEAREEGRAELTAGSVGETEVSLPTSDPTDSEGQQTAGIQQAVEEFRENAAELQITEEDIRETGDELQEAGADARDNGDQTADTQQTGEAVRVTEDTQSEIQQSSEAEEQPEDETEQTQNISRSADASEFIPEAADDTEETGSFTPAASSEMEVTFAETQVPADAVSQSRVPVRGIFIGAAAVVFAVIVLFIALRVGRR